jgi:hypothetical protein
MSAPRPATPDPAHDHPEAARTVLLLADCRHALEAGFDLHMVKPVDLDRLERLLAGEDVASLKI